MKKTESEIRTDDYFLTVSEKARAEIKVKGSLFIGTISPAASRQQAEDFIADIRRTFHDATHNCFAYRLDPQTFRYSDDGEPSGTAGKPILTMIDKYQLQQVVLVVTRYFGGTKLGTGGLIRAYGEAAEAAIRNVSIVKRFREVEVRVAYPFSQINRVQHLVHQYRGRIKEDATQEGMVANIHLLPSRVQGFKEELVQRTSGQVTFLSFPETANL